ncbi:MAG: histidine phosphatase family protein [Clostridia bacterium]|nr:histidine phosphatase family protein [Clostridia bacterium]
MKATKLYLIRHGESEANARDVFLGHTDLELTAKGKAQAEQTASFLQTVNADVIYASDLQRAYHTAQATAKRLGLPVVKDERLREIYCGEWENKSFSYLQEAYKESYGVWCNNVGLSQTDGGESVEELQARIVAALQEIAEKNSGKTVLVFTHATPIRCFAGYCEKKSLAALKEIPWASNASVTHAVYREGEFTLVEYSKDDFLGEMKTELPANV